MKIHVKDNRGCGQALFTALEQAGHALTNSGPGDVLLTDSDADLEPYRTLCDQHERVFIHPHGAGYIKPNPPHPHTRGYFVTSQGQADALRNSGINLPIHIMGFHLAPIRKFRPCDLKANPRVIFAPTHAMAGGHMEEPSMIVDQAWQIYEWLEGLPIQLTVRTVEGRWPYEFPHREGVAYQDGTGMLNDAIDAIADHEMVIAGAWTFPTLAVAMGVPTFQYGLAKARPSSREALRDLLTVTSWFEPFHSRYHWIGDPWDAGSFVAGFNLAVETW